MIGDAAIVALGEGDHGGAEPLAFRNRVLEYLVEAKGFTAIALESGIVEGRVVHDYVRGGAGDLSTVVAEGISWNFDRLPQNRALVRWLREYNRDPRRARKVNFYGFDVPGSPGDPSAKRGADTALTEVLRYLHVVDRPAAADLGARLDTLLPHLRSGPSIHTDGPGYHRLPQSGRDALTAALADAVALMERREARYTAASSRDDYEWAHRAALGARQVDCRLRHVPFGWRASREQVIEFLDAAPDLRDRAQADNLDWIVRREGRLGKVLVFAHNAHLSTTPSHWSYWPLDQAGQRQAAEASASRHEGAGTYLRRRYGDRLVTIGNVIGQGELGLAGSTKVIAPALPESVDGIAREVGMPRYLLDMRPAPLAVTGWLEEPRELGRGFDWLKKYRVSIRLAVAKAFDVLFYLDTVTPACVHTERSG